MSVPSAVSRRQLLAGSGLAVVGVATAAAAGALGGAFARPPSRVDGAGQPAPPNGSAAGPTPETSELDAALAREHALLAGINLALQADPGQLVLTATQADHQAHATAIATALGAAGSSIAGPSASAQSPAPKTSPGQSVPTTAALRAAEQSAQTAADAASTRLHGADAVLLACIAASEAGHVELLA